MLFVVHVDDFDECPGNIYLLSLSLFPPLSLSLYPSLSISLPPLSPSPLSISLPLSHSLSLVTLLFHYLYLYSEELVYYSFETFSLSLSSPITSLIIL